MSVAEFLPFPPATAALLVVGGLAGLPVGVLMLDRVNTGLLEGVVGAILIGYSLYNLLHGHIRLPRWGGTGADAIGGAGGVLGGATGLAGVAPTLWCAMRGWAPTSSAAPTSRSSSRSWPFPSPVMP